MNPSVKKVKSTISRYHMIRPGDRVIVAVSGGADSVCLLDVLHKLMEQLGIELFVAHFDHGLRPEEDEAETRFVRSLAVSHGLPFETEKALSGIKTGAGPLEERARLARYRFFEEVSVKCSAQKIAVGHNLNDQAETVLMRLLRGSGLSGLAGIPPKRDGKIIRPLIEMTRDEIMDYIAQEKLEYVTDQSNFETRFLRNRLRLEIMPRLKEIQPRIIHILGQASDIMRRDNEWMASESEKWVGKAAETGPEGELQVPLPSFKQLADAIKYRVIRHALKKTGGTLRRITMRHIEAVNQLASADKPQSRIDLPNDLTVKRVYDTLVFSRGEGEGFEPFSCTLDGPGVFYLEKPAYTFLLEELDPTDLPDQYNDQWTAFLNADRITYPLVIRNFRPGDKFVPLGMSGHKKLKDFFIDLKIPAEVRTRIPILTHKDKPVWVCGYRIDDRFRVMSDAGKVLKVTLVSKGP